MDDVEDAPISGVHAGHALAIQRHICRALGVSPGALRDPVVLEVRPEIRGRGRGLVAGAHFPGAERVPIDAWQGGTGARQWAAAAPDLAGASGFKFGKLGKAADTLDLVRPGAQAAHELAPFLFTPALGSPDLFAVRRKELGGGPAEMNGRSDGPRGRLDELSASRGDRGELRSGVIVSGNFETVAS
mmetsp:Transcript_113846/g.317992  ORF Transcript_113846/g.317992 Transcript_113846/m.317992 type:complete len:187 (-) Transcript_113846:78-638(-)